MEVCLTNLNMVKYSILNERLIDTQGVIYNHIEVSNSVFGERKLGRMVRYSLAALKWEVVLVQTKST